MQVWARALVLRARSTSGRVQRPGPNSGRLPARSQSLVTNRRSAARARHDRALCVRPALLTRPAAQTRVYSYGLCSYGLYSYGLYSYGLYSYASLLTRPAAQTRVYRYGLYSYGLYSYGLYSYASLLTRPAAQTRVWSTEQADSPIYSRPVQLWPVWIWPV